MDIQQAIGRAMKGQDTSYDDMLEVVRQIMSGQATEAQIAGLLVALHMKGETIEEVTAAATVMRELSTKVNVDVDPLIDTCGTGGDGTSTFNISTATAFVVAAAGGFVAKHGNRSVSSSSGSADVLEQFGARIDLNPDAVKSCIETIGVGFMFAPAHHSATRHAAGPRKELGVRTLFNVLGPLTNPAGAPIQLMGVFDRKWQRIAVEVLARLGTTRAFAVTADDGLDEISIGAKTHVAALENGEIREFDIDPGDFGVTRQSVEQLVAKDARHSAHIIREIFDNRSGPAHDIVSLNAGAAIHLCDLCSSINEGIALARGKIADGSVKRKLDEFVEFTKSAQ